MSTEEHQPRYRSRLFPRCDFLADTHPLEGGPDAVRDGAGALARALDEDVDEVALGARQLVLVAEQADLVAHAGRAEVADPQAAVDQVGEGQGDVEAAAGLDRDADHL